MREDGREGGGGGREWEGRGGREMEGGVALAWESAGEKHQSARREGGASERSLLPAEGSTNLQPLVA